MDPGGQPSVSRPQEIPDQPSSDGGAPTSRAPGDVPCRHPLLRQRSFGGGLGGAPGQGCVAPSRSLSRGGARPRGLREGCSDASKGPGSTRRRTWAYGGPNERPGFGGFIVSGGAPTSGSREPRQCTRARRAPCVFCQHGVAGREGTVPHALEAPARALGGLA